MAMHVPSGYVSGSGYSRGPYEHFTIDRAIDDKAKYVGKKAAEIGVAATMNSLSQGTCVKRKRSTHMER